MSMYFYSDHLMELSKLVMMLKNCGFGVKLSKMTQMAILFSSIN